MLLALSGVAAAENLTLTTGIKYNNTIYNGYTSEIGSDPGNNGNIGGTSDYTVDNLISCTYDPWAGTASSITFNVSIKDLFNATSIADTDTITLNSFTIKAQANGWAMDNDRVITLYDGADANGTVITTKTLVTGSVNSTKGELTLSDLNYSGLTKNSKLTLTLTNSTNNDGCSIAIATTSTAGAEWSGVSSVTLTEDGTQTTGTPLVSLNITTASVPEPTTATLSLLALAGLAARRRRNK